MTQQQMPCDFVDKIYKDIQVSPQCGLAGVASVILVGMNELTH